MYDDEAITKAIEERIHEGCYCKDCRDSQYVEASDAFEKNLKQWNKKTWSDLGKDKDQCDTSSS